MGKFIITGPDGKEYEVHAPDGATEADVLAYAKSQFWNAAPPRKTIQDVSPFDQNIVNRGDVFYPFGTEKDTGKEVLAWPHAVKNIVEGAMMPGHLLSGGTVTPDEMMTGAMAITPGGRGIVQSKMRPKTSKEVKAPATKLYGEVEQSPAILAPKDSLDLLTGLEAMLRDESILLSGYPKVRTILQDLKRYKGSEIPMKRLMAHLRVLNKDVGKDEARVAGIVSDYIKEHFAKNTVPEAIDDFAKLKQADTLWAKGKTLKLMENSIEKAKHAPVGFESGLRNEFRKILNKVIDEKLYVPADVKKAIELVVDGSASTAVLRKIGKLGPGIGNQTNMLVTGLLGGAGVTGMATGNPAIAAAAAATSVAGAAAQQGARKATISAAQDTLAKQGGLTPTGQHRVPIAPTNALPKMLSPQMGGGEYPPGHPLRGLLFDEYGPFL